MTQNAIHRATQPLPGAPWIRIFPVRTPTLPPATHTNVYIVGERRLVVIDPASPYPDEQAALDQALDDLERDGHQVVELLLTHHHLDHVLGARHLAERRSLPVAAHPATATKLAGQLTVSRSLQDGDQVALEPAPLTALWTPGHAPGHLCFFEPAAGAVIAGDMVASTGTIVIDPYDSGNMGEYLSSLERLRALEPRWLLPAHGPPISDPRARLDFYLAHRREREGRVMAALSSTPRSIGELVAPAYPDVPVELHPLAARSLLAHLLKLEQEGHARRTGELWFSVADPRQ